MALLPVALEVLTIILVVMVVLAQLAPQVVGARAVIVVDCILVQVVPEVLTGEMMDNLVPQRRLGKLA